MTEPDPIAALAAQLEELRGQLARYTGETGHLRARLEEDSGQVVMLRLEIKQLAGVAAFTSDGDNRVYQPGQSGKKKSGHGSKQVCGWSESSFVIMVEPDDDRPQFEEHYQISSDGQRLVQLVLIKSGRMTGFSMSRVWDRVQAP